MTRTDAFKIASNLAVAATGTVPVPLSSDLSDNTARAKNLMVWETFRAFYHGVVKADADTSWPDPVSAAAPPPAVSLGSLLTSLPNEAAALAPLLAGLSPAAAAALKLAASVLTQATAPAKPLPSPGV